MCTCEGDLLVLGAGGKMGFHLCLMLKRAIDHTSDGRRLIAVSRFQSAASRDRFRNAGIDTIATDLSDPRQVEELPTAVNVFFLAGIKFGTSANPELLRRMNEQVPALIARRFTAARTVAFSTGCVYSFTTPESGGSDEDSPTDPPGEYATSCLGREQAFREAAETQGTRSVLIRLNYAIDLRYGVLVDIAHKVKSGRPIDVSMGFFNAIWQGDALNQIIQSLPYASAPPAVFNITGAETYRVRDIANRFAEKFHTQAHFTGSEANTAWLSNASKSHAIFGEPATDLDTMIDWIADWIKRGGETLGKPTHFETRDGNY